MSGVSTGVALKEEGMSLAADSRKEILSLAQSLAIEIGLQRPTQEVTADDVQIALKRQGRSSDELGNAAGSIFRGRRWEHTGKWVNSCRPSSHARAIRVWKLK